jgi:hypothetical protein
MFAFAAVPQYLFHITVEVLSHTTGQRVQHVMHVDVRQHMKLRRFGPGRYPIGLSLADSFRRFPSRFFPYSFLARPSTPVAWLASSTSWQAAQLDILAPAAFSVVWVIVPDFYGSRNYDNFPPMMDSNGFRPINSPWLLTNEPFLERVNSQRMML